MLITLLMFTCKSIYWKCERFVKETNLWFLSIDILKSVKMLVTSKRQVVEEEVTRFINVKEYQKQMREKMKYEQNRLNSFLAHSIWHIGPDKRRLAKAGLYCDHNGNTKCFSCGLFKRMSFWEEEDPETVHRVLKPNCKFIKGDNVPIEKYTHETVSMCGKRQDSEPTSGNALMIKSPQRKETNTKVKTQTKNDTDAKNQSPRGTKEGNTERKNNTLSPRLQPSSVQTGEPDKIPTTDRQTAERRAKVSVGKNLTDSEFCITLGFGLS